MNRLTILIIMLASSTFIAGIGTTKLTIPSPIYRDGEGNPIPQRAVDSLVSDQFIHLSPAGRDTIRKYFYFYQQQQDAAVQAHIHRVVKLMKAESHY